MDLYLLHPTTFIPQEIIDGFHSFIWTERYDDVGDFELVMPWYPGIRKKYPVGTYLGHSETNRGAVIEEGFDTTDPEGLKMFTVRGHLLEGMLHIRSVTPNRTRQLSWIMSSATPGEAAHELVKNVMVQGNLMSQNDIIDGLNMDQYTPNDETEQEEIAIPPQTLYTAVTSLCASELLGYRIRIHPGQNPRMTFGIYKGVNREEVIFSSQLNSLVEESRIDSVNEFRTTAYVFCKDNIYREIVQAPRTSSAARNLNRRVMVVEATDIDPFNEELPLTQNETRALLKQRGLEALAGQKRRDYLDGLVPHYTNYVFRQHYDLGDIVSLSDQLGVNDTARVLEYIWVVDAEGKRSYPTFRSTESE